MATHAKAPRYSLNLPALYQAVDERRRLLGWSWRKLARELRFSEGTFINMSKNPTKYVPSGELLLCLLVWLGIGYEDFLDPPRVSQEFVRDPLAAMCNALRASNVAEDRKRKMETILRAAYRVLVTEAAQ